MCYLVDSNLRITSSNFVIICSMYTSTISQILPHFPCTTCLCCANKFSSVLCPKTFSVFVTNEIKY